MLLTVSRRRKKTKGLNQLQLKHQASQSNFTPYRFIVAVFVLYVHAPIYIVLQVSVSSVLLAFLCVLISTDPSQDHYLLHLIHQRIKLLPFISMPFSLRQHGNGTTALPKSTFDLWMMISAMSYMTWDQERLNGD